MRNMSQFTLVMDEDQMALVLDLIGLGLAVVHDPSAVPALVAQTTSSEQVLGREECTHLFNGLAAINEQIVKVRMARVEGFMPMAPMANGVQLS